MKNGECKVVIVEHPAGIIQGCKVCKTILSKGNFLIGLHVQGGEREVKYLLGAPPQECCGEQKTLFQCFDAIGGAEAEKDRIIEYLSQHGTTEELPLLSFFDPTLH